MADKVRERPYVQFNFLVNLKRPGMDPSKPIGGFQEVSGIGMEVTVAEYRTGNMFENSVLKVMGMNKSSDVTLKRGIIGALDLYSWLDDIREGRPNYLSDVDIQLQSEDHQVILTWTL